MTWLFLLGAVGVALGLGMLTTGVLRHRRYRYVADVPTVAARATAVGLSEVKGRAVAAGEPFDSPFQEEPSVLCHYAFHGRRPEPENWSPPREMGTLGVPFYVEDETGRVLVRPEGAEIGLPEHLTEFSVDEERIEALEPEAVERYKERRRNGSLPELGGGRAVAASASFALADGRREGPPAGPSCGAELRLEEGDEVYVIGSARLREAGGQAAVGGGGDDPALVIAADPEGGAFGRLFGSIPYLSAAYGSIFEIFAGSEEELLARRRAELRKGMALGFALLLFGLVCGLWPWLGGGGG